MKMTRSFIANRLAVLRKEMASRELDAFFSLNFSNVTYLSGFTGEESFVLLTGKDHGAANYFITDSRYTEQAEAECPDYQVIKYRDKYPPLAETVALLSREQGVKRIGFEREHIPYSRFEELQAAMPAGMELVPVSGLTEKLRIVKDAGEQELLRHACACTDAVFNGLCEYIHAGRTEKEVEWQLLTLTHEMGCGVSFPPIVVSGERGSLPHGRASDKVLVDGEFLTMDFGCLYGGYHAEMTRTVCIGSATPKHIEIYNIVLEANQRAEAIMRAGISGKAVDAAARDFITEKGYGANFGHGLGHGVGLDIHEQVFMSPRCEDDLPAGCVMTVEPGIYLPNWGGVRIEDSVLVTENGIENLFAATKDMLCL